MSETISFLPSYKDQPTKAAEYLRQALPLMSRNKISTDPTNYAIWYEYVAGKNGALKEAIDAMIEKKTAFDPATSKALYKKYICNDSIESFESVRSNLLKLLGKTQQDVNKAGDTASEASGQFCEKTKLLENSKDISDIKNIVSEIVAETSHLAEASQTLKKELDKTNSEIETLRSELEIVKEASVTDALTGLLNRRAFDSEINNIIEVAEVYPQGVVLLLMDLDHFKRVNDDFGHLVGDKVLRYTSALMKQHVDENHLVARYGGEEMAVIMPNTNRDKAIEIANKIRLALAKSRLQRKDNGESIGQITISIGAAKLESHDTFDSFVGRADECLYKAKETGRNRVIDDSTL
ncbi:MAG: GGDEF domain-containing protein [Gammaproteobacteria bacterium]|nr:MAG: GGDEF domain-containing protein [Gammaproteobacteria bacterium]